MWIDQYRVETPAEFMTDFGAVIQSMLKNTTTLQQSTPAWNLIFKRSESSALPLKEVFTSNSSNSFNVNVDLTNLFQSFDLNCRPNLIYDLGFRHRQAKTKLTDLGH
jgi:hypothetical protein